MKSKKEAIFDPKNRDNFPVGKYLTLALEALRSNQGTLLSHLLSKVHPFGLTFESGVEILLKEPGSVLKREVETRVQSLNRLFFLGKSLKENELLTATAKDTFDLLDSGRLEPNSLMTRIAQRCVCGGRFGEIICYKTTSGVDVLASSLIDDGNSSRSQRELILDPSIKFLGAHSGRLRTGEDVTIVILTDEVVNGAKETLQLRREDLPSFRKMAINAKKMAVTLKQHLYDFQDDLRIVSLPPYNTGGEARASPHENYLTMKVARTLQADGIKALTKLAKSIEEKTRLSCGNGQDAFNAELSQGEEGGSKERMGSIDEGVETRPRHGSISKRQIRPSPGTSPFEDTLDIPRSMTMRLESPSQKNGASTQKGILRNSGHKQDEQQEALDMVPLWTKNGVPRNLRESIENHLHPPTPVTAIYDAMGKAHHAKNGSEAKDSLINQAHQRTISAQLPESSEKNGIAGALLKITPKAKKITKGSRVYDVISYFDIVSKKT
jgi:hypothetical protein